MIPRSGKHIDDLLVEKALHNGYDESDVTFFLKVSGDYPELRIRAGRKFAFRPPRTIAVGPAEPQARLLFLHEISHALCEHRDFKMDVERLKMEVEAWEKARELAPEYGVDVDEDLIQSELDTYRDWLHKKSRCPHCGLTRFQTPDRVYHCPNCEMI